MAAADAAAADDDAADDDDDDDDAVLARSSFHPATALTIFLLVEARQLKFNACTTSSAARAGTEGKGTARIFLVSKQQEHTQKQIDSSTTIIHAVCVCAALVYQCQQHPCESEATGSVRP